MSCQRASLLPMFLGLTLIATPPASDTDSEHSEIPDKPTSRRPALHQEATPTTLRKSNGKPGHSGTCQRFSSSPSFKAARPAPPRWGLRHMPHRYESCCSDQMGITQCLLKANSTPPWTRPRPSDGTPSARNRNGGFSKQESKPASSATRYAVSSAERTPARPTRKRT